MSCPLLIPRYTDNWVFCNLVTPGKLVIDDISSDILLYIVLKCPIWYNIPNKISRSMPMWPIELLESFLVAVHEYFS